MSNPGHAHIQGAMVLYLYAAPTVKADLEDELKVLEGFTKAWNKDDPDQKGMKPAATKAPPPLAYILVTAANHKSTHASSAQQPRHITAFIADAAGWALTPHESGATVHVFPVDEDPAKGYKDYLIHNKAKNKLNSATIKQRIADAEAHNLLA